MSVSCPYHPQASLVEDYAAGDMICPECGLVVGDRVIDVRAEWYSNRDSQNSRIGHAEIEAKGYSTSIETRQQPKSFFSLLHPSSLDMGFSELKTMTHRINLTTGILDTAKHIFRLTHRTFMAKGKSRSTLAAACLYIACRKEGVPRSIKEILAVSHSTKKDIQRCVTAIHRYGDIERGRIITSSDFVSRFAGSLGLPRHLHEVANHVASKTQEMEIAQGKSPISIAAAAIYLVSQTSCVKKDVLEVSQVSGVAHQAIKVSYRLMLPYAAYLLPISYSTATPISLLPKHEKRSRPRKRTPNIVNEE